MISPNVEAILDVLVAGTDFPGLRRALFVTVACHHMGIRALEAEVAEYASEGRMPLDVLLARLPTRTLTSIAVISKGRTGIKDAKPGPYPLVVTAEKRGSSDHFDFEGPGVMIPMVSSTGHGDASLKRVHFQDGKYAVGSILSIVQPRDPEQLSARYLHAYLSAFKDELLVSRMVGTANVSLTVAKIGEVPVPLLPVGAQRKVDELMALCDRLEAEQADAEAAHAKLVQALLASLTQARDAADFRASWQQLAEHFHMLFTTEASVEALKQTVLQLGVMGKLVPQDMSEGTGLELLRDIEDAKARAVELVPRRNVRTVRRSEESFEAPYALPQSWTWVTAEQISSEIVDCPHSTPKFVSAGALCLDTNSIKRGSLLTHKLRYVDEETYRDRVSRLVPQADDIVFAREGSVGESYVIPSGVKCCLGQRVMLFRPCLVSPSYFRLALSEPGALARQLALHKGIGAKHVNVADMRAAHVALPPLAEQKRIVGKVEQLLALCDQLKLHLGQAHQKNEHLASALVVQAVS